jgi:hypothetical protein
MNPKACASRMPYSLLNVEMQGRVPELMTTPGEKFTFNVKFPLASGLA